ncbi:carboxypeptidase-like regulatory domain-containing protein [Rubrivirga sp.]|uniref:carboxypeptidase-like regulatory domain-containing protein n=1 Tax=Rubrivirga sp. TaxID=1885344 RepID=UPI003C778BD6
MRVLLFLVLSASVSAQTGAVSGAVLDAEGSPLPGASVYLSGTTRGDATDLEGAFDIPAIEAGAYRLVVSMLGFETDVQDITVDSTDLEVAIVLEAEPLDLGVVEVEAERDGRWERRFRQFRHALIGESSRADSTRIVNPEVLSFRSRWGTLHATAAAPLVIENRALGYRLVYDLHVFEGGATSIRYDGDERFHALEAASDLEAERWESARLEAYRGSLRHLLRALLAGTAEDDGFSFALVWEDPWGARPTFRSSARGIMHLEEDGWGTLRVRDRLDVTYTEPEDPAYLESDWFSERRRRPNGEQRSSLYVERGRARIDPQGTPVDPFAVSVSGYLGFERLADRVPEDYGPAR